MMSALMDAILGLVVVEALVLAFFRARTGGGIALRALIPNLAAGFMLLLTARLALGGAPTLALAASLLGALFAHLADLGLRWQRPRPTR